MYDVIPQLFIAFIVASSTAGKSVVGPYTALIDTALTDFVNGNSEFIDFKTGYYDYASDPSKKALIPKALSADNQTMVFTIIFKQKATLNDINPVVDKLLKFAE